MDCNLLQNMLTFCNKIVTTWTESDRDSQHEKRHRIGKDLLDIYFILGKWQTFSRYSNLMRDMK